MFLQHMVHASNKTGDHDGENGADMVLQGAQELFDTLAEDGCIKQQAMEQLFAGQGGAQMMTQLDLNQDGEVGQLLLEESITCQC